MPIIFHIPQITNWTGQPSGLKRMGINIFNTDFHEFLISLENSKVEYVLVGGYSVIIHGYNRTTGDLDIFVNPTEENYKRLLKAFHIFGMSVFDMHLESFVDTNNFDVFEFGRPPVAIDILTKLKGVDFNLAFQNKIRYAVDEQLYINVLHLNTLILSKKIAGRSKDLNDIEHLQKNEDSVNDNA